MTVLISILVPREGHDLAKIGDMSALETISIHVPREGHDLAWGFELAPVGFQSTCPARGTT